MDEEELAPLDLGDQVDDGDQAELMKDHWDKIRGGQDEEAQDR